VKVVCHQCLQDVTKNCQVSMCILVGIFEPFDYGVVFAEFALQAMTICHAGQD